MREIDVDQLEQEMIAGATVVDVREVAEYAEVHVPDAVLVPMGQLPARMTQLDRSEPVYLICRAGGRSAAMCRLLAANGFDAVNVRGGTAAWLRAGKPYQQGLVRA